MPFATGESRRGTSPIIEIWIQQLVSSAWGNLESQSVRVVALLGPCFPIQKTGTLDKFSTRFIPFKQSRFYIIKTKGWSRFGVPKAFI